jgi:FKBP-type peptidyl-prolyl cis-trans isomerase
LIYYIWVPLFAVLLVSCSGCKEQKHTNETVEYKTVEEQLIEANRQKLRQEMAEIDGYIEKKGWPMVESPTGLHYWIYEQGDSTLIKTGDYTTINFSITLMDGTLCYSSDLDGARSFRVGHDDVESGLHEAMTYLHLNDKARLILPSHLAYGFTGDNSKVPQNATLVYDLEVIGNQ